MIPGGIVLIFMEEMKIFDISRCAPSMLYDISCLEIVLWISFCINQSVEISYPGARV
jgi:hypothetical protein